jgi:hypothetical protein
MRRIMLSAMVLVVMSSAAAAEPRKLADAELGNMTGGLYDFVFIVPITIVVSDANSAAVGNGSGDVSSNATSDVIVNNIIGVDQTNQLIGTIFPAQPRPVSGGSPAGWWPWAEPRPGQASLGLDPLRSALLLSGMLQSRYLGPGW